MPETLNREEVKRLCNEEDPDNFKFAYRIYILAQREIKWAYNK